jgi:hypothetical protein
MTLYNQTKKLMPLLQLEYFTLGAGTSLGIYGVIKDEPIPLIISIACLIVSSVASKRLETIVKD